MSFDDYARHITQKYRLAISIAIINTKPENLTVDEYIEQVKSYIIKKNINNDQNIDGDNSILSISACSDDFNIHCLDDDNDFNGDDQEYMNHNRLSYDLKGFNKRNKDHTKVYKGVSDTQLKNKDRQNNETLLHDEDVQLNDKENQSNDETLGSIDFNESLTILHNFKELDANKERRDKFREVIQVLKGVDVITTDQVLEFHYLESDITSIIVNDTQRICSEDLQTKPFDPMDLDLTQCYEENYSTLSNSILKLTKIDKKRYEDTCGGNFETNDILSKQIPTSTLYGQNDNLKDIKSGIVNIINKNKGVNTSNIKTAKQVQNVQAVDVRVATEKYANAKTLTENFKVNIKDTDTLPEYSQYNTHYSASEMDEVRIDDKLIYGKMNNSQVNANLKKVGSEFNMLNYQEIFDKKNQNDTTKNNIEKASAFSLDTQSQYPNNESQPRQNIIQNDRACPTDIVDIPLDKDQNEVSDNFTENDTVCSQDQNMDVNDNTFNPNTSTHVFDETTDKDCPIFDRTVNTDKNDKIPFKIIEEMNRIKVYLKRNEFTGCSSTYRSSQSFGFLKSTQSEYLATEQSAFSLFNYLTSCPLVVTTQVLTEQISEVLGQLIDRLHEKEIYPPFLEELLNTIKSTLKLVCEEENYVFDVLLNKDEQIQRIILLNKSMHIQKFTIEKINNILQKLLDETSADTTSDIQNINRMENLCYIFHILQIILPKYRTNYIKPTQTLQEDRILRKTDITDVWRKKWIVNFKEISNEGSLEKNCVLKECSEVLNKIIVSCMDGYSLVAFSALQCFNLMQS